MMHKACHSIEEVPYGFLRSSIKFQGHTGWRIDDLSKITRPVAAIKSLRFALFFIGPVDNKSAMAMAEQVTSFITEPLMSQFIDQYAWNSGVFFFHIIISSIHNGDLPTVGGLVTPYAIEYLD